MTKKKDTTPRTEDKVSSASLERYVRMSPRGTKFTRDETFKSSAATVLPNKPATAESSESRSISSENRPPLQSETSDIAFEIFQLGDRVCDNWPRHVANLREAVETPFPEKFLPQGSDWRAVLELLEGIGRAMHGMGNWDSVRAAHLAFQNAQLGAQEKQAKGYAKCLWAREALRKMNRKRPCGITPEEHARDVRRRELRIARTLRAALGDIYPALRVLEPTQVLRALEDVRKPITGPGRRESLTGTGRRESRFRPELLLEILAGLARTPMGTADAIKAAHVKYGK